MKNSSRPFVPGIINHCYQNSINGALLFYSVSDFLVMFTLVCVASKRYDVKVLALCFMPDHIHGSYVAVSKSKLSAFVGYYSSEYVKMFNDYYGRSGPLFNRPFGSVPKIGDKKGRTNLIYVDNNPVERRLSKDAVLYRWNFLAYGQSKHPFSEPIKRRTASSTLKKAMTIVDLQSSRGHPLTFALLGKWFSRLSKKESLQLVDYIITTYSVIDYDAAARFFGGFDNMLLAIRSTTGSEYDLNEPFEGRNDYAGPGCKVFASSAVPKGEQRCCRQKPRSKARNLKWMIHSTIVILGCIDLGCPDMAKSLTINKKALRRL